MTEWGLVAIGLGSFLFEWHRVSILAGCWYHWLSICYLLLLMYSFPLLGECVHISFECSYYVECGCERERERGVSAQ